VRLSRLEILGFKSFADPVELAFPTGITAIIGPNGCGKSNVADALRWVLGNSNPRQLRVERMEEVIFSGSSGRKPLGMAEVRAVFDNEDRALPVEFSEVAISRRFFRSGDGEYSINGSHCRLMDVTDLIADVGLASNGYWILEADMVKTLLSPKPEDRRFLFDEASGIVRYKIQRHRAELKLAAAAADLERLDDVLSEVRRNTEALKRQAALLQRYEKAAKSVAAIDALLESRERASVESALSGLREQLRQLLAAEQDMGAELSAVSARHAASKLELERAQTRLDEAHARCSSLEKERSDAERDLAVADEKSRSLTEQKEDLAARSSEARARAAAMMESAGRSRALFEELAKEVDSGRTALARLTEAVSEAAAGLADARKRADEARHSLSSARAVVEGLRASLSSARAGRAEAADRLAEGRAATGILRSEMERLESELTESAAVSRSADAQAASAGKRLEAAASARASAQSVHSGRSSELAGAQASWALASSRVAGLESGSPEAASDALSALLSPPEGCARALEAFLDAFQEATPVEPGRVEGERGRRVLIPVPSPPPGLPAGAKLLSSLFETVPRGLEGLLSSCILAPDRESAERWLLEGSRLPIVTPGGDLFRPEGLARLGVPEEGAGPLARKALLEEARLVLGSAGKALSACQASEAESRKALAKAVTAEEKARDELAGALRKSASAEAEASSLISARERTGMALADLERSIPLLEEELRAHDESDLQGRIEEAEASEGRALGAVDDCSSVVQERQELHNSRLREEAGAAGNLRLLEARMEGAAASASQAAASARSSLEEADSLGERAAAVEKGMEELRAASEAVSKRIGALGAELAEAHGNRSSAASARAARLEESTALESRVSHLRESLAELREKRAGLSSEAAMSEERLKRPFDESALPPEGSRLAALDDDQLRRERARTASEREGLGPVNMLATQEYYEARQRMEFLETQRQDLLHARQSLLQAIGEINATAAVRFRETFESVRTNFRDLFSRLFEGGEADIQFIESADPLEGGVAISARPRGKKLETLAALSGGERAMTAVALLFALYLVKPSPFCVLDELDAPLDDANVDRFIDLLESFSASTQFIVITHNRRTMEAADRLFGVTMAEEGVSTQASVSLEAMAEGAE